MTTRQTPREKIGDFVRRENSKIWDCICRNEKCGKVFSINCQPKNWKYRYVFKWDKNEVFDNLCLFCSDECKKEALK